MVKKSSVNNFSEHLKQFIGQRIAVLCVRFQYRGILTEVGDNYLVLANATAVEISGSSMAERPNTEDNCNGSITLKTDAIELAHQPKWVYAPLPNEEGWTGTSS